MPISIEEAVKMIKEEYAKGERRMLSVNVLISEDGIEKVDMVWIDEPKPVVVLPLQLLNDGTSPEETAKGVESLLRQAVKVAKVQIKRGKRGRKLFGIFG